MPTPPQPTPAAPVQPSPSFQRARLASSLVLLLVGTAAGAAVWHVLARPLPAEEAQRAARAHAAAANLDPDLVARGRQLFAANCMLCHGLGGRGVPGVGNPAVPSDFVADNTDDALLAFLRAGRDATDPANRTRVAMPPRGGNPALTDDHLRALVAYLRAQQAAHAGRTTSP